MDRTISEKIKMLGFFMTCAMVFFHCVGLVDDSCARGALDARLNALLDEAFVTIGVLVMSHFFTMTGFLLFRGYSLKDYPRKMKRRVLALLLPYVCWQGIIAVVDVLQKQYRFTLSDFLRRTFLLVTWPVDGPMWYMYAVFLMALLSPLLLLLFRNRKAAWIAVLVLTVALEARDRITAPGFVSVIRYGYVWNILFYLPCYLVGAFCGRFAGEDTEKEPLLYALSLVFLAMLLDGVFERMFFYTAVKMMPLAILCLCPPVPALRDRRIFALTFLIYAIHQPLISDLWPAVLAVWSRLGLPAAAMNLLTKLVMLCASIALAKLIHSVLKRFAPRTLDLLTGGRC